MKKLSTALIALFMVMVMCFSSFADVAEEGSITIKDPQAGRTYDIYRIFDLTGSGVNTNSEYVNYAYTVAQKWESFFFGEDVPGEKYLVLKTKENEAKYIGYNELTYVDPEGKRSTYFMNIVNDNVAQFAQDALDFCAANNPQADDTYTAPENIDGDYIFENIKLGYYLIYPQGATDIKEDYASICSLDTTSPKADVTIKATYPEIVKTVDDASAEVGQVVTFTVTGQVPDTTGYESYIYKVKDIMTEGLTFNDDVDNLTVTFGTSPITVPEDKKVTYTIVDNGFDLQFDMAKYQEYKGSEITITYQAVVNDKAVVKVTENKATLTYSNDPEDETKTKTTPEINVPVYSSEIVVNKVDNASPSQPLAQASFCLMKKATSSDAEPNRYYKYTEKTETTPAKVEWVEAKDSATIRTTDGSGITDFKGLEDGTYYLREVEAPKGYSLLDHDVVITIDASEHKDPETRKIVGITHTEEIENVPGKRLPATGGTGTTILYIIGGILVVGAGILLITKKRIESEE